MCPLAQVATSRFEEMRFALYPPRYLCVTPVQVERKPHLVITSAYVPILAKSRRIIISRCILIKKKRFDLIGSNVRVFMCLGW